MSFWGTTPTSTWGTTWSGDKNRAVIGARFGLAPKIPWSTGTQAQPGLNAPAPPTSTQAKGTGGTAAGSYFGRPAAGDPADMTKPGTGEQWWKDHQDEINKPGEAGSFINEAAGRLLGQNYQPDHTVDANNTIKTELSTPGQGVVNSHDVSGELRAPTEGENIERGAAGYFQGPNLAHDYAADTQGFFKEPANSQTNLGVVDENLGKIHYGDQGVDYASNELTSHANDFYNHNDVEGFSRQNTVGDESKFFLPGLREKSRSENLYDSGNEGLNTFYDREAQKRSKALTDRLAATGMFGSGQTVRGLEEIQADLGASQARDMAALAKQADDALLGRSGAGLDWSSAAGNEAIDRFGLGEKAAVDADESQRGNVTTMLKATGQASDEALGKIGARTTASHFADTDSLEKVLGGSTVAKTGDDSLFNQGEKLGNLGHNLAVDEVNRLGKSAETGIAADSERDQQLGVLLKSATSLDDLVQKATQIGINMTEVIGQLKLAKDAADRRRILENFGMSKDVQELFEKRWGDQFERVLETGRAQADVITHGTDKISDEDTSLGKDYINGLIRSAALTQEQGDQLMEEFMKGGAVFLQIMSTIKGG